MLRITLMPEDNYGWISASSSSLDTVKGAQSSAHGTKHVPGVEQAHARAPAASSATTSVSSSRKGSVCRSMCCRPGTGCGVRGASRGVGRGRLRLICRLFNGQNNKQRDYGYKRLSLNYQLLSAVGGPPGVGLPACIAAAIAGFRSVHRS